MPEDAEDGELRGRRGKVFELWTATNALFLAARCQASVDSEMEIQKTGILETSWGFVHAVVFTARWKDVTYPKHIDLETTT
jgi:hypothetical protein